jgi:hypothetical protein
MRWNDVDQHLRTRHMVLRREAMVLSFEAGGAIIEAAFAAVGTRERAVLGIEVCRVEDAESTIERSDPLLEGALVRYRGKLIYRVVVPLDTTSPSDLDRMIGLLVRAVMQLRGSLRLAKHPIAC